MAIRDELTEQEKGVIQQFKDKAREFWRWWENLSQQKSFVDRQNPQLQKEYEELMNRGVDIRSKIEWITGAIDRAVNLYESAKDWFLETVGLDEIQAEKMAKQSDLAIAPLVAIGGVAVISGAIAAIGKWVADAVTMSRRLAEIRRLEGEGYTSEQAHKIVEKSFPADTGFLAPLKNIGLPLGLAAIALIFISRARS